MPFYQVDSADFDLPEYQGDEHFIVTKKCEAAYEQFQCSVLVEDTCLSIECLQGLPGPYVKWFLDKIGTEGLYRMTAGYTDKRAVIRCLLGFLDNETGQCHIFKVRLKQNLNYKFCFKLQ
jgi:inosine triphosphate pyrophosphatase